MTVYNTTDCRAI